MDTSYTSGFINYNSLDPDTNTVKWDRLKDVEIWNFEMEKSIYEALEAWNVTTENWSRN